MNRVLVLVLLMSMLSACGQVEPVQIDGATMGTTYSVKLVSDDVDIKVLSEAVEAELRRVNAIMSTYIPDSEISRFNQAPLDTWFPVSADMIKILQLSKQIHNWSGGSFDVTIGPLVNLWGFGPTPMDRRVPTPAEIDSARARVGFDLLEIGDGQLRKSAPIYLDLSAIAKGYGVDRLAAMVEAHGYRNYLVEIGGELRGAGVNARGIPWRIAIERPDIAGRVPFRTLGIDDMAMATSGDYRNFFEIDGERYSHTINPVTGSPITHTLASVTVLAPTCAEADGLATAINVLGPEAGLALAGEQNIAAFVIIKTESGFSETYSPAFKVYLDD
ncbi:MAG: FAD:protein FMN transferase [Pseudomonadales bacterium]